MRKTLISLLLFALPLAAADLDFKEAFADPATRGTALARLVPQTRDWYFYTALNHQLAGRADEFRRIINEWQAAADKKGSPVSRDGAEVLENRELLLRFDAHPKKATEALILRAGLKFEDTKPDAQADRKLSDRLDPQFLTEAVFEKLAAERTRNEAYRQYSKERLIAELDRLQTFDEAKLRWFNENLERADHPAVVPLIVKVLGLAPAPMIDQSSVEHLLTRAQLDELLAALPDLRGNEKIALRYLTTLLPGAETDFELDPAAHAAHLAACRDFALTLPPALNSLKAHVLFHHLRLQRELGLFPQEDFLTYLRLPRASHRILLPAKPDARDSAIDTSLDFGSATACPPVGDDSDLANAYLAHFLGSAETPELFKDLIEEKALRRIHARSRLLAGADPVRWGGELDPAEVLKLQQETRISFAPGQPVILPAEAAVKLALDLKYTPELLVRIFELDLPAWIEREGSEPPVDLDLEGLVPHHEKRLAFAQSPLAVHREILDLPELSGPGAWVVECVSRGSSSRALVRKGRLMPFVEHQARGQTVRVFDEKGTLLKDATVELGTETLKAGEDGRIVIPDKSTSTRSEGLVRHGKLAVPLELEERHDDIALDARFHLDREQLLADQQANLFLRLRLKSHGHEIPLEWIDKPSLVMEATLIGGVKTERVIGGDLKLAARMFIPFQVPADTTSLKLRISGTVTPRDGDDPVPLEASEIYSLNGIATTGRIAAGFFTLDTAGHRLEVRGRNGEPLASRPLTLRFKHRDHAEDISYLLRTDDQGILRLGPLDGIQKVTATGSDISTISYQPQDEAGWSDLPDHFTLTPGDEIRLPLTRPMATPERGRISLSERRDGVPLRDQFDKLAIENRRLVVRGLPPGDFLLTLDGEEITVNVSEGVLQDGVMVSASRILPRHLPAVPFIASVTPEGGTLTVHVDGISPGTRVSLMGRRYLYNWPSGALQPFAAPEPDKVIPGFTGNAFLEDRRVGDETRYILERRAAKTFPGSMLPRPGLLVNRWSEDDLLQAEQEGAGGGGGRGSGEGRGSKRSPAKASAPAESPGGGNEAYTIDFLANASVLRQDLAIGADGTVQVPAADFAACQYIEVVAAAEAGRHHLIVPLAASATPLRDRRLAKPLDAQKYHVGTRRAASLAKGAEAAIESVIDADWRAFTTLAEAHAFLLGASGDSKLNDFLPLLDWPALDEKAKLAFLSEHACNELHLFLARKDPEFFNKHVKPMLSEKREPGLIDDILLGRDLSAYLRPYAWQRLNAAEKALLSQAMPEIRERIATELGQRWELEAPTPEQETILFTQTLRGTDLDPTDSLGLARNVEELSTKATAMARMGSGGTHAILTKLKEIQIPRIDFKETTVEEAIDFLRLRSIELDRSESDPTKKGINFVIRRPRSNSPDSVLDSDAAGGLGATNDPGALRIKELRLRDVPLAEALKYICEQTKLRYKVDEYAVTLVPATETDEDLFNRTFKVPPGFLAMLQGGGSGDDPSTPESRGLGARKDEVALLKDNGIKFPEGASAKLFAGNNTLLLRNTPTNIDLVEQIIANMWEAALNEGTAGGVQGAAADAFAPAPSQNFIPEADMAADPFGAAPTSRPSWSSERDQTRLWRESNYYKHRGKTDESFIPLNRFWLDLAAWDGKGGFISPNFNACTHHANEALLCLALLDLPFKAERPETKVEGSALRVKASEPMLLFYKDTRETQKIAPDAPVLVRQTFQRLDDRFRTVEGRQIENSITGDFLTGVPYGASLVVTNPSGAGRRIDVLAQIPAGAIPLEGMPVTTSSTHELQPYGVLNLRLAFYFPMAGEFALYPLQVSEGDTILARGEGKILKASAEPPPVDAGSWPALARDATDEVVLVRLRTANLKATDLKLIRWRLREPGFFHEAAKILRERLFYSSDVAAYALFHADVPAMRDAIENSPLADQLGEWLDSPLLNVRPLVHRGWETLEFDPLVNPRAHRFADKERLTHADASSHYQDFLELLAWKPALGADDHLALTAHLLLQERIAEALARFDTIDPAALTSRMAYDYIEAVVDFHRAKPEDARVLAMKHATLPPGLWQDRFNAILTQANEIVTLQVPRAIEQQRPKEEAPSLDLALAADGKLQVKQHGLEKTLLQLFSVDLEVMFSKDPFLAGDGASLPGIRANETREVALAGPETTIELPENFRRGNVLVAARSGTTRVLKVLDSRAIETIRQPLDRTVQVYDSTSRLPLPQCYVKVYIEGSDGVAKFHKDGYTDLRGKFDYLSHTGTGIGEIRRIAILTSHPDRGARIEIFNL